METYNDNYTVYVHLNKKNGKCYVGVTKKKNPNGRWHNGNGYSYNTYFYNAIQKYGWDNFEHIIYASNLTKEEASNAEKLLITLLYADNTKYGYNLCSGGYNCQGLRGEKNYMYGKYPKNAVEASVAARKGKHLSNEHKQKISNANKGKQKSSIAIAKSVASRKIKGYPDYSGSNNPAAKKVICVETGIIFDTVKDAAAHIGVVKSAIVQAIKRKQKSKGFHWSYL